MKKIQNILNFIYPEVCFWCEKISKENPCKKCQKELENISEFHLASQLDEMKHAYLFRYEGKIRDKLLSYKFNEKLYLKDGLANLFEKNEKMYCFLKNYDIIIPVPIHKKKKRERGYNQSELIAKKISHDIENLKLETNVLRKIQNNEPQSILNGKARRENVKGVYDVKHKDKITNKKIILLDDIYTTGSTVKECRKMLLQAGAKTVDIVTIAKD